MRRLVASLQRLRADVNAARRLQFAGLHDGVGPTPTKETTPIHRLTRTPVDAIFTTVDNQRHTAQSILCKFHVGRHFIPIQFLVFFSNSKGKMATLDTRPNSLEMAVSTEPFSGLFFFPPFSSSSSSSSFFYIVSVLPSSANSASSVFLFFRFFLKTNNNKK